MSHASEKPEMADDIYLIHSKIVSQIQDDCQPHLLLPLLDSQYRLMRQAITDGKDGTDRLLQKSAASREAKGPQLSTNAEALKEQLKLLTAQRDELEQRLLSGSQKWTQLIEEAETAKQAATDECARVKEKYAKLMKQCKIFKETIRQLREDQQQRPAAAAAGHGLVSTGCQTEEASTRDTGSELCPDPQAAASAEDIVAQLRATDQQMAEFFGVADARLAEQASRVVALADRVSKAQAAAASSRGAADELKMKCAKLIKLNKAMREQLHKRAAAESSSDDAHVVANSSSCSGGGEDSGDAATARLELQKVRQACSELLPSVAGSSSSSDESLARSTDQLTEAELVLRLAAALRQQLARQFDSLDRLVTPAVGDWASASCNGGAEADAAASDASKFQQLYEKCTAMVEAFVHVSRVLSDQCKAMGLPDGQGVGGCVRNALEVAGRLSHSTERCAALEVEIGAFRNATLGIICGSSFDESNSTGEIAEALNAKFDSLEAKRRDVESQLANALVQRDQLSTELTSSHAEIEKLRQTIVAEEGRLSGAENQREQLNAEVTACRVNERLVEVEKQCELLVAELSASKAEIEQLRQTATLSEEKLTDSEKQREELSTKLTCSEEDAERLRLAVSTAEERLASAEKQREELVAEIETYRTDVEKLRQSGADVEARLAEADTHSQLLSAELAARKAEVEQLSQAINDAEQTLADADKQRDQLIEELKASRANESDSSMQMEKQLEYLNDQLIKSETTVQELRQVIAGHEQRLGDSEMRCGQLSTELASSKEELEVLRRTALDAEQKLMESEKLLREQSSEMAATHTEIGQLRLTIENSEKLAQPEKQQELQQAARDTNDIEEKLANVERQREQLRAELTTAKLEVEQLRLTLEDSQKRFLEVERLKSELMASRSEIEQLHQTLADVEQMRTEADKLQQQQSSELTASRSEIEQLRQTVTDAEQKLAEAHQQQQQHNAELTASRSEIEQLRQTVADAEQKLAEAHRQQQQHNAELTASRSEIEQLRQTIVDTEQRLAERDLQHQSSDLTVGRSEVESVPKACQAGADSEHRLPAAEAACQCELLSPTQLIEANAALSKLAVEASDADQLKRRLISVEHVLDDMKNQNGALLADLELGRKNFQKLLAENRQLKERLTEGSIADSPDADVGEAVAVDGADSNGQVKQLTTQLSRARGQLIQLRSERNKIYHEYMRVRKEKEACERQLASDGTKNSEDEIAASRLSSTATTAAAEPPQVEASEIQGSSVSLHAESAAAAAAATAGQREEELMAIRSENEGLKFRQSLLETKVKKMEIRMRAQRDKLERYQLRFDEKDRELDQLVDKVRHHRAMFDGEKSARLREVNQLKAALATEEARARRMEKQRPRDGNGNGSSETQALLEELGAARRAQSETEQRHASEVATLRAQLDELSADCQELRVQLEAKRRRSGSGGGGASTDADPIDCAECKRLKEAVRVLEAQKQRHRSSSQSEQQQQAPQQQHQQLLQSAAAAFDAALRGRGLSGVAVGTDSAEAADALLRACAARVETLAAELASVTPDPPVVRAETALAETQTLADIDVSAKVAATSATEPNSLPSTPAVPDAVSVDMPTATASAMGSGPVGDWLRMARPRLRGWPALHRARLGPRTLAGVYLCAVHFYLLYCLLA